MLGSLLMALGLAVAPFLTAAAEATPCEAPLDTLYHGCAGRDAARVFLVPDDLPLPTTGVASAIIVTGSYTGRDTRPEGTPAPVGIAVVEGRVIGRTLARMDGILLIGADGAPRLMRSDAVVLDGQNYDLRQPTVRARFLEAASGAGVSALQSHLLVINGAVDTRPVDGAPMATRRVFYQKGDTFGLWESEGALTLDQAAREIARTIVPDMALNLDMGSFNLCLARSGDEQRDCGLNANGWETRLSTLLMLYRR
ncbi:MAG: hypothetical protein AAF577_10895 [Pseudomonadota bacterium]